MRIRATATVLSALIVAACGSDEGTESPRRAPRPRSTAVVKIAEPAPGAAIPGLQVRIRLELTGGRIVAETSKNLKPDEGHLHLTLDGKIVSMTFGLEQEVTVEKPGTHLLQAEFVAADHAPFNPRVLVTTTFSTQ